MPMSIIPASFLFRISYPCPYVKEVPRDGDDRLLDLPGTCRVDHIAPLDRKKRFADVRLAWNELGLAFQAEVRGKEELPQGDADRVRGSDGVTLWLDTRDSRASHRASRFCHQFHFVPTGGGSNHDEPFWAQAKIPPAPHDPPLAGANARALQCAGRQRGYPEEAFL